MSLLSRLTARLYKLPPAETCDVAVDKNLEVPMPDGAVGFTQWAIARDAGPVLKAIST